MTFCEARQTASFTIVANGAQNPSSNHELFVFRKTQGRWKLARYSFSSALSAT
jgi:ketosteroid isomerase-like protein